MKIFLPWLLHYNRPNPRKRRSHDIIHEAEEAEDQLVTRLAVMETLASLSPLEQKVAELLERGSPLTAIAAELQLGRQVVRRIKADLERHFEPFRHDWGQG